MVSKHSPIRNRLVRTHCPTTNFLLRFPGDERVRIDRSARALRLLQIETRLSMTERDQNGAGELFGAESRRSFTCSSAGIG